MEKSMETQPHNPTDTLYSTVHVVHLWWCFLCLSSVKECLRDSQAFCTEQGQNAKAQWERINNLEEQVSINIYINIQPCTTYSPSTTSIGGKTCCNRPGWLLPALRHWQWWALDLTSELCADYVLRCKIVWDQTKKWPQFHQNLETPGPNQEN